MVTRFKVWNWLEDQEEICMRWKNYLVQVWAGLSHFLAGWSILQVVGVRFINIVFVAIIVFVLHCGLCSTTVDQSYLSQQRIDMLRNSPHTFPQKYFKRISYHIWNSIHCIHLFWYKHLWKWLFLLVFVKHFSSL